MAAAQDARPYPFDQENRCNAMQADNASECFRSYGHVDRGNGWDHNRHISFDSDSYEDWPTSVSERAISRAKAELRQLSDGW